MDVGAEDPNRWDAGDTTILQLHVDDEPVFVPAARLTGFISTARQFTVRCLRPVRWAWLTPLLTLVLCGSWFATGLAPFDSPQQQVRTGDMERAVRSELSDQLLGDVRVNRVRCVRQTESNARCVAELFDKGGDGPIVQGVIVSIDDDTSEYVWQPGPAH
jgi:hypothetical protein